MKKNAFTIEFSLNKKERSQSKNSIPYNYEAAITMISKSFNLFEVNQIKRKTKDGLLEISGNYILTSYPLSNLKDPVWKDVITLECNSLLQTIGSTIDQYLSESNKETASQN